MKDRQGREYAKLSKLKLLDRIELDDGFTCALGHRTVLKDDKGLYFMCSEGNHYLQGQADDNDNLIGVYHLPRWG